MNMKSCETCVNGPLPNLTRLSCGTCVKHSNWTGMFTNRPIPDKSCETPKRSKYHREIKPGIWIDVYDVLNAFNVTNPADAHAIKKMLMPGQRGHKDAVSDRHEAIASIERAIEIEEGRK